ncbi:MAG: paraquat-inducible protein A [Betaproteobacteria bacterium]
MARAKACCRRCGVVLYVEAGESIERSLALTLAAMILFVIANSLSIASLDVQGQHRETSLLGAIEVLYDQDKAAVAALVFGTTILAPGVELCALAYMLLPLWLGRIPRYLPQAFRLVESARGWGLVDVFMLGVLVSLVKLGDLATVLPGVAIWSFGALVLLLSTIGTMFEKREIWARAEAIRTGGEELRAARTGAGDAR